MIEFALCVIAALVVLGLFGMMSSDDSENNNAIDDIIDRLDSGYYDEDLQGMLDEEEVYKTNSNVVYIWKVKGHKNLYKIGMTSARRGHERIAEVAAYVGGVGHQGWELMQDNGLFKAHARIIEYVITPNAREIEKTLLAMGEQTDVFKGAGGHTEFRYFNMKELKEVRNTLNRMV